MVRCFARTSFSYLFAYRSGEDIQVVSADAWVKKHRVHRGHSKRMDAVIDREVDEGFDAELECLYYPLCRPVVNDNIAEEHDDDDDESEINEIPEIIPAPESDLDDNLDDLINLNDEIEGPYPDELAVMD
jgi:hypothetical protein